MRKKIVYLTTVLFCISLMALSNNNNKNSHDPVYKDKIREIPVAKEAEDADDIMMVVPITHLLLEQI
jgi:preprotein translocase subunit SecG